MIHSYGRLGLSHAMLPSIVTLCYLQSLKIPCMLWMVTAIPIIHRTGQAAASDLNGVNEIFGQYHAKDLRQTRMVIYNQTICLLEKRDTASTS